MDTVRWLLLSLSLLAACSSEAPVGDAGTTDAGTTDAGSIDAGSIDAGSIDAGAIDAGSTDGGTLATLLDLHVGAFVATAPTDLTRCASAVAVVVTSDAVLVRGYGARTAQDPRPPDEHSVYQLGSLTKVLTGLGLARLVTTGAASATTPVTMHLHADLASAFAVQAPTLVALTSHTARLPTMPDNLVRQADGGVDPLNPTALYGRAELANFLQRWAPLDAGYHYSNVGTGLLAIALEDTLDAGGYAPTLRALVTGPLALDDTWGQVSALSPDAEARLVDGHFARQGRWWPGRPASLGVLAGGGEALSTGADLAQLLASLTGLTPGALDDAITLALTPVAPITPTRDVGYGVAIDHRDGGDAFLKDGETPTFSAFIAWQRAPSPRGVAVIAACGAPFPVDRVTLDLFEAVRRH